MEKNNTIHDRINAPVQEAYNVLRSNIQFCTFDKNIKTLSITSCNPGDGKTSTSVNLAISMAKSGLKTVLVDADLRKPMMLKHLGSNYTTGLSNFISGHASFEDVVNETNISGMYYVGCGPKPPNPVELIGSNRFVEFLNRAENEFDMVIIDTPPLGSVIDSAVIAAKTDGVILVIKAKSVNYRTAQRIKEQLVKANARILGVVLNKVKKNEYKNYYSHYNYYGGSKDYMKNWNNAGGWFKKSKKDGKVVT